MMTVRDLLQRKGTNVWSISPDASVFDAIKLMAEKGIGALLVIDADKLVGIFSERDYARKVVLKGKSSKKTACREIMTDKICYVSPERTLDECMALMTEKRIRHLPVIEGERIAGFLSMRTVLRTLLGR